MRTTVGFTEWSLVIGALVAVVVAAANYLMGGGFFFAWFALAYCAMVGWMYWHSRATRMNLKAASFLGEAVREKDEVHRLLRFVDLLQGLSNAQIRQVAALGRTLRRSEGAVIGQAGQTGDTLFVILKGMVQLTAKSPIGETTVRVAGPGEALPLAAVIGSSTLITSMIAMTDLEVLAVPTSSLRELCTDHPEIGMRLYESIAALLANRYRSTLAHLTEGMATLLRDAGFWANV